MTFTLNIRTRDEMAATETENARQSAKLRILSKLDGAADEITGATPLAERLSWERKANAAEAHLEGRASDAQIAMLSTEAAEVEASIDDLAHVILRNATVYAVLAARLAGLRRKFIRQIERAENVSDVHAIVQEFEAALHDLGA